MTHFALLDAVCFVRLVVVRELLQPEIERLSGMKVSTHLVVFLSDALVSAQKHDLHVDVVRESCRGAFGGIEHRCQHQGFPGTSHQTIGWHKLVAIR